MKKYTVLLIVGLSFFIAMFDRVNLSIAAPYIIRDLGISTAQMGLIFSAFFFGYTLIMIPGGRIAERVGVKKTLIFGITWWSIFTGVFGMAGSFSLMISTRILFGLGEALHPPSAGTIIYNWFKGGKLSFANSLYFLAVAIAPALVPIIGFPIIEHFGWRWLFYLSALPGFVIAIIIALWVKEKPDSEMKNETVTKKEIVPLKTILSNGNLWLASIAYFGYGLALYGLISWLPTYLITFKQLATTETGILSSLPYALGVVGLMIGGMIGDKFIERRKYFVAATFVGAALGLGLVPFAQSIGILAATLGLAGFCMYMGMGPFLSMVEFICPSSHVSTAIGVIMTGHTIAAIITTSLIGLLVQRTGSFTAGFFVMVIGLIIAAVSTVAIHPKSYTKQADNVVNI